MTRHKAIAGAALALVMTLGGATFAYAQITPPEKAFAQPVGSDYFLADYTAYEAYLKTLAGQSDRIVVTVFPESHIRCSAPGRFATNDVPCAAGNHAGRRRGGAAVCVGGVPPYRSADAPGLAVKAEGGGVEPPRLIARPFSKRGPSPIGLSFRQ